MLTELETKELIKLDSKKNKGWMSNKEFKRLNELSNKLKNK